MSNILKCVWCLFLSRMFTDRNKDAFFVIIYFSTFIFLISVHHRQILFNIIIFFSPFSKFSKIWVKDAKDLLSRAKMLLLSKVNGLCQKVSISFKRPKKSPHNGPLNVCELHLPGVLFVSNSCLVSCEIERLEWFRVSFPTISHG